MSSFISNIAGSHRLQLGLTVVVTACLTTAAVIGVQKAKRSYQVSDLKDSIPDLDSPHDIEKVIISS